MLEVFGSAVSYVFMMLVILCLMLAIFFGPQNSVESSYINWIDYHGGTWDGMGDLHRAPLASVIANYIVIFAAIDGLAVFPLLTVSLGDILLYAFTGERGMGIDMTGGKELPSVFWPPSHKRLVPCL